MKNLNNMNKDRIYYLSCCVFVSILALLFAFPLYWIISGSFKTGAEINATTPVWVPADLDLGNYMRLMSKRSAPLFDITIPALQIKFGKYLIRLGKTLVITGPTVPAAIRWLINTVRGLHADHLPDLRHGRLCSGQEALLGQDPDLLPGCLRHGSAQAGYPDPASP